MATTDNQILSPRQINYIKKLCRKNGIRKDQVDDCLQEFVLKILQENNSDKLLNSRAINNYIKSIFRKEYRYRKYLLQLQDTFQESIIYSHSLQIDVRSTIISMPQLHQNICKLLAAGFTRKQISQKLKISRRTISREILVIKNRLSKFYR